MKQIVFAPTTTGVSVIERVLGELGAIRKNQQAVLKLIRIRRRVEQAKRDFEEARVALVKRYAGEDGNVPQSGPQYEAFVREYQELLEQDVPAEVFAEKLKLDELWYHGENGARVLIDVTENMIDVLGELIDMEEEPAAAEPAPAGE